MIVCILRVAEVSLVVLELELAVVPAALRVAKPSRLSDATRSYCTEKSNNNQIASKMISHFPYTHNTRLSTVTCQRNGAIAKPKNQ